MQAKTRFPQAQSRFDNLLPTRVGIKSVIRYRSFRSGLFLVLTLTLLSARETGCKQKSDANGVPQLATKVRTAKFLQEKLRNHDLREARTLSASAKVFFEGNGQSISVNTNLIWMRDSMVWLNVKKLGIEAARALITPDSVYLINRLEKTYSIRSIESLQRAYGLPGSFAALQQTLLGSAFFLPGIQLSPDLADSQHRLSGSDGVFGADYRLDEGAFLLRSEAFYQKKEGKNAIFSFENYRKLPDAGQFPYLRRIEALSSEGDKVNLEIEFNNVEINVPKTWRFEIPAHYERIE